MEKAELVEHFVEHSDVYEWAEGECNDQAGVFVKNKQFETETHFTDEAI